MGILCGNKDYYDLLGYITMKSPVCKRQRIFAVKQERKKLTVYFIPTFQFSSRQVVICENCKEAFEVEEEQKSRVAENMISQKKLDSLKKSGKLDYLTGDIPRRRPRKTVRMYCPSWKTRSIKNGIWSHAVTNYEHRTDVRQILSDLPCGDHTGSCRPRPGVRSYRG
jgi:uncharacterized protein YbaR (Trm112 family)